MGRAMLDCLFALAGSLLATSTAHSEDQAGGAKKSWMYKDIDGKKKLQADVYGASGGELRPVILYFHGGALMSGDCRWTSQALVAALTKAKYIVVSANYRLAPEAKLPAIIEDIKDAYQWVREKGPELFHADARKIAVMGDSAGGYLTLMAGFHFEPRPSALVSFYGYGDVAGPWYSKPDPFYCKQPKISKEEAEKAGGMKFYLYCRQQGLWPQAVTGHDPAAEPKAFDPFCPVRNVTAAYPPTFLIHGDKDTDVPYELSAAMAKELAAKGVAHEFITVPNGPHGFVGKLASDEAYAKHLERMIAFLGKYLGP